MVATSFMVATLLAQCFLRVDVATMVSRRDLVVFPFYYILIHDLSFKLRPPFSGHNLVCGLLPSQVSKLSHDHKVMSRLLSMFIPSSGHNLNSLLQLVSSFQPLFQVATTKLCRDLMLLFFWLHLVPIAQK